jgi:ABC-type nitrate/sulfonate/bicarbonate transport system substrate-binding protein
LVSGDVHIGWTAGEFIGAVARGVDFVVVATFAGKVTEDLVARPGLTHPSDLRGKRFGIQSFGGGAWIKARLGLEYLGLVPDRDRMRVLVIGDQTLRAQSLERGIIDASTFSGIFSKKLMQKGFPILADFSRYNIPVMSSGVVVKNSYAQQHSDTLENVLKGLLEGLAFVLNPKNRPIVIRALMKWLKNFQPGRC